MLPQGFRDELRARTPMASLVGRRVKLSKSGRHWKGCCPFHSEKSPSFYVYEDGFHCFGCSAHGDAIEFVMRTEGASFIEAVEKLAAEVGLEVPRASPAAEEAERRRVDLHDVLDAAQVFYAKSLYQPEGAEGLAYLRRRNLTAETIKNFGLGWSGGGRGALSRQLQADGATTELLLAAGLLRQDEHANPTGELFFNRVMFPIRDRSGRIVSFGGRILGDGQPKYLNGPETAVYSKRRTLFGLDRARAGVARGDTLVVVEGYMDVIALHQAGFGGAVAPLGTALTEEQLEQLWRLSPLPVLCFDGDTAGAKAAARAAIAALPHLTPEKSLKICALANGDDPDSLIVRAGAEAFRAALAAADPLARALYRLLRETGGDKTPEQRAGFRKRLEDAALQIRDKSLAGEYRRDLLDQLFAGRKRGVTTAPRAGRPAPDLRDVQAERGRTLTAIILRHPSLLPSLEEAWADVTMPPYLARLRDGILGVAFSDTPLDETALIAHLHSLGLAGDLQNALGDRPFPLAACASADAMPADAAAGFWHIWGLMHPGRLDEEVDAAFRAYFSAPDEMLRVRWQSLLRERERSRRFRLHDGVGDDGSAEADEGYGDGAGPGDPAGTTGAA